MSVNDNDFKDPRHKELYELQMLAETFSVTYEKIKVLAESLYAEGTHVIEIPPHHLTPKPNQSYLVIHNQFESGKAALAFAPKYRIKFQKTLPKSSTNNGEVE